MGEEIKRPLGRNRQKGGAAKRGTESVCVCKEEREREEEGGNVKAEKGAVDRFVVGREFAANEGRA